MSQNNNVRFWHRADTGNNSLMLPFGTPAKSGRQALLRLPAKKARYAGTRYAASLPYCPVNRSVLENVF